MKILLIIPAYNEQENIEKLIEYVIKLKYDYVIIDDCSKDNTLKICKNKHYNVVRLPINLGIGGAVQTGYKYAKEYNYDIAVQLDGDGQHNPEEVKKIVKAILDDRAEIVIGSRFIEQIDNGFKSTLIRRVGITYLSFLIKLLTGKKIYDVTSGFRAVNRKFIEIYAEKYAQDYPEPEAIVTACKYNAKIIEIPVIMNERQGGESSINHIRSIYYMIKVTIAMILQKFIK